MSGKPAGRLLRRRGRHAVGWPARLTKSSATLSLAAGVVGGYLRFVRATSRFRYEPASFTEASDGHLPIIGVGWHGQMLLMPTVDFGGNPVDVLVSRHTDGELMARVLAKFGYGTVRGSGTADPARMHEKGGVSAFRGMKASLDEGRTVVMTADSLRNARRQVSRGVVTLGRLTGRPIVPLAVASNRRVHLESWDETTVNLPFSRVAMVAGDPHFVPADVDEAEAERIRVAVGHGIDATVERARELADRR